MGKKPKFVWLLLIIFSLVILFHFFGFVVELLFGFGILETDIAKVRGFNLVAQILSLALVISGIFFVMNLSKLSKKAFRWWDIFMGVAFLMIIYKLFNPTALVFYIPGSFLKIPSYFYILFALVIFSWYVVRLYLKYLDEKSVLN